MKTSQILIRVVILSAILIGGFLYKNHRVQIAQTESDIVSLSDAAGKTFAKMKELYEQRVEILREIDPKMAKQIQSQVSALRLDTQEGLDQFDYFQNLVSERLTAFLASAAGKKSPLVLKLKELEILLIRNRADFHRHAFEANEKIASIRSGTKEIAVFKAEKMLHEMETKSEKK